jgi:ketosteroid isomerase-like protein
MHFQEIPMQKQLRLVRCAALFALVLALPAMARAQETSDTTKLAAGLRTVRASYSKALTSMDANAAAAAFADSVYIEFQGQAFAGKQAAVGWLSEALQGVSALRFSEPTFTISADQVVERTTYTVSTPGGDNQGSTESTWKKQKDGSWKLLRLVVT